MEREKTCLHCEQLIQAKDSTFVRGRFYQRMKLFCVQRKIGDFHNEFYIKQIEKLVYHRNCYKLLGKYQVAKTRHEAFQSLPGHISTRSDYSERFKCEPDGQLQSEYFDNNRTLSMEGCCLDRFTTSDNVMQFLTEGGDYVPAENDQHREFHLHLSDTKYQNAATTTQHLFSVLGKLFDNGNMTRHGTMWDQTDGCSKQYLPYCGYRLLR